MAGPLMVIYFVVITLIIERDAELLKRQLALRAQAERDLIALADTLDDKVRLRTRQLEDMVSGLKSFAGMVSHDLRGPLGNAASLAHLAEQAMREGRLDVAQRWVQLIERESRRACTMVDDLLRLAQVDQGPMNLAPVDLQALVGECVDALALQYPKAQQQVRIQDLPTLPVDAGMMRHVLLNLLSNALKFGHDLPGLSICVSARRLSEVWRFGRMNCSSPSPGCPPATCPAAASA
jgi:signal transduction histidine kinase